MKADIDQHGCLSVTPETPLEHYALSEWFKGWQKPEGEQRTLLHITFPDDGYLGTVRVGEVLPDHVKGVKHDA